jgi:hypothetical protein
MVCFTPVQEISEHYSQEIPAPHSAFGLLAFVRDNKVSPELETVPADEEECAAKEARTGTERCQHSRYR